LTGGCIACCQTTATGSSPVDETIAEEWGRLNAPDPLPVIDSLLAATAKVRGMTFVTRNVRDIETTGVDWFNPFDDSKTAGAP
jgi:hypothetical protein